MVKGRFVQIGGYFARIEGRRVAVFTKYGKKRGRPFMRLSKAEILMLRGIARTARGALVLGSAFTVSANQNGVKVGCTEVPYQETERFARLLGL